MQGCRTQGTGRKPVNRPRHGRCLGTVRARPQSRRACSVGEVSHRHRPRLEPSTRGGKRAQTHTQRAPIRAARTQQIHRTSRYQRIRGTQTHIQFLTESIGRGKVAHRERARGKGAPLTNRTKVQAARHQRARGHPVHRAGEQNTLSTHGERTQSARTRSIRHKLHSHSPGLQTGLREDHVPKPEGQCTCGGSACNQLQRAAGNHPGAGHRSGCNIQTLTESISHGGVTDIHSEC